MDYAYAPGGGGYGRKMRRLLFRRGATLVPRKLAKTVVAFIQHLDSSSSVSKPVGDLYLVSHGNDAGELEIPLVHPKQTDVSYETVLEAKNQDKLLVPSSLVEAPGGGPIVLTTVRIRGCKIGQSLKMMTLFKEAFGSNVASVAAPLHQHAVRAWGTGYFECLYHGFEVFTKERFTKRDDVIDAFKAAGFQYWNGTNVHPDVWEHWVPGPRKFKRRPQKLRPRIEVPLGTEIKGLEKLPLDRWYWHHIERVRLLFDLVGNPSDDDAYMRDGLRASPLFDPSYGDGYPVYKRYWLVTSNGPRFQNLDEFLNAFTWKPTRVYNKKQEKWKLSCVGRRHAYEVRIPLTSSGALDGDLLFNFFPNRGSSLLPKPYLPEDDDRLFIMVP